MRYAVLVAGGTGGHINAALALGESLSSEGWEVEYFTGKRPLDYKLFSQVKTRHLDSKPLRTKNPFQLISNVIMNFFSFFLIITAFLKKRPSLIIGAGGYVCGPTLVAGRMLGVPVFIIEQNAVMGLTNRILGWISTRIFVHFSKTRGLSERLKKKVKVVGNPTRKAIQPVSTRAFDGELKVLVFGGSLGALQINKVIWDILANPKVQKLSIHHQLGIEVKPPEISTTAHYVPMGYIENMQREYEWCDVIISRAGASTVSELSIIKKPVLIFPYPQATDNHQVYNAQIFQEESDFTVEILDPRLSHDECVRRTQEFLVKASLQELKYSQQPSRGNHTCAEVLREIKLHVRMV
jgi:UDP-N-acetylglucosamine--N-acetylmuramyl-(pentapeptide) pyrophosphoryl-undecaprenol N-acetylglucosamine transferase